MEPGHSHTYAEHFREMVEAGDDVEGEARFVDAVVPPASRILDAGCGQGRTAGALTQRGHEVVGVDIDDVLIGAARLDHPGPTYIEADLSTLDLGESRFDAAVSAGNVLTFVAPGSQVQTLRAIRRHLRGDAVYVVGFHVERYDIVDFDAHVREAEFDIEQRFATWDLRPWHPEAEFCVTILRVPQDEGSAEYIHEPHESAHG